MNRFFWAGFCAALALASGRADDQTRTPTPYPAKVSANGRFLLDQSGKPFFWLADTAWELFHRCNREDADFYLRNRAAKKFNVIQAVVLAEFGGLVQPNPYGHLPLKNSDPTQPDEEYFRHVDWIVNRADELGLVIGMLPTWGDKWNKKWGEGPEIFTVENAVVYGEWLARRYRDKPIVWILGGDRPIENDKQRALIRSIAAGLRKGDGGAHLITYHPSGGQSSASWLHGEEWLAFNMLQSGHDYDRDNWRRIAADYARKPAKPCLDGEAGYEDHPAGFKKERGYLTDVDVRKFAYWAVFAGACGHTYGCHDIWQFLQEGRIPITFARTSWRTAIDLPGAGQLRHLRALIESHDYLSRVPDHGLVVDCLTAADRIEATRGDGYALVYSATGQPFEFRLGKIRGERVKSVWFDPRAGETQEIGVFENRSTRTFAPPSSGKGNDWVLVLESAQ
jgi:hypothetical protein